MNTTNPQPISLIISPITSDTQKKSNIDYQEQLSRSETGLQMMWDDTRFNNAKPNDLFAFWKYNIGIEVHRITGIGDPQNRMPSWSDNVGQTDRNVVFLSEQISFIEWDEWIRLNGAKRCMGTSCVKKGLKNILNFLNMGSSI